MENEYHEWTEQLERFVVARLGDPLLAEDIVQEALFRLVCRRSQGQVVKHPKAWLYQTVRNLSVDVVRSKLPKPLGVEALAALPDPSTLPLEREVIHTRVGEANRKEVLQLIPEILDRLPEEERATLIARYRYGVSCQRMAELAGISIGNAKVRLHRARRRVRDAVERRLEAEVKP